MTDDKAVPRTDYKLESDSELRFEIENKNEKVTVVVGRRATDAGTA